MRKKATVFGLMIAFIAQITFVNGEEKVEPVRGETSKPVAKATGENSPALKVVKSSVAGKYSGAIAPHKNCDGCHTSAVIEKEAGKYFLAFNVHGKGKRDKKYSMQGSVLKNGAVLFERGKIILVARDGKIVGGIIGKKGDELAGIEMTPTTEKKK